MNEWPRCFVLFFISMLLNPFNYRIFFALYISNFLTCFLFKCHLISLTWLVINVKCFFLETAKRKDVKPPAALKEKGNVLSLCGWDITSRPHERVCWYLSVVSIYFESQAFGEKELNLASSHLKDLIYWKEQCLTRFRNNKIITLIVVFFNCCLTCTANIAVGMLVYSEWISNRAVTEFTWQAEIIGCTGISAWFELQNICRLI